MMGGDSRPSSVQEIQDFSTRLWYISQETTFLMKQHHTAGHRLSSPPRVYTFVTLLLNGHFALGHRPHFHNNCSCSVYYLNYFPKQLDIKAQLNLMTSKTQQPRF